MTWQVRLGPVYSGGTGGTARVSVQADDGTGKPSGTRLASLTYSPRTSPTTGILRKMSFPSPATLTSGRLYHIVFENVDSAPTKNWFSVNEAYAFADYSPRQPIVSQDYAVMTNRGSGWSVNGRHTADMDLTYADGTHDGLAYINALREYYGLIGGQNRVRERFTVSGGSRLIRTAFVRVARQSGSGNLTIRLEKGDGTLIEQGTVATASISSWSLGSDSKNGDWVSVQFQSDHTLSNGATYNLVLSAPSGTQLSMVPLHHTQDNTSDSYGGARLNSWAFDDGFGQKSTDGGSSWSSFYQWSPVNMQFYFR